MVQPSAYALERLLGHADWFGQGEQQPYGSGITETTRPGTLGGDEPAALQTGGNAQ